MSNLEKLELVGDSVGVATKRQRRSLLLQRATLSAISPSDQQPGWSLNMLIILIPMSRVKGVLIKL